MLYIKKGNEPISLTAYKKAEYAYFDGCNKDDIRESLLKEQGYLCAYCMQRISKENMKIEHWMPEAKLTDSERLDYKNMLGCCNGHLSETTGKDDICDTHKGSTVITVNPLNESCIKAIKYSSKNGRIYSDNEDFNNDLDIVLNLNNKAHMLKENRKTVLDIFRKHLRQKKASGKWTKSMLEKYKKHYEQPDESGMKKPYSGIILWYINKKLSETYK